MSTASEISFPAAPMLAVKSTVSPVPSAADTPCVSLFVIAKTKAVTALAALQSAPSANASAANTFVPAVKFSVEAIVLPTVPPTRAVTAHTSRAKSPALTKSCA